MRSVGLVTACVVTTGMLWVAGPASAAVKCGQPGADGQPVTGDLTRQDNSTSDLNFGTDDGTDEFILYMKVTGCALTSAVGIDVTPRVSSQAQDALGTPDLKPKGSLLEVVIPVEASKFPTKLFKPVVTLSSTNDAIATTQVALTMQRKEPPLGPGLLGLAAFIAGFWWALHLAKTTIRDKLKTTERIEFKRRHAVSACVGALIGAVPTFTASYLTPDTWTLDLGTGLALVVAVASASAGGATAGAGAAYAVAKRKQKKEAAKAEAARTPA